MSELREIIEAKVKILSEKTEEDSMDILVSWIQSDKKNQNGRTYKLSLLQREVSRIQSAVRKGAFVGTGDHPAGGLADVATASHIVNKIWLDEKGKGMAEMKIIGTERGKNIMTLIRNNAQLGVSARGFGNVSPAGFVEDDYRLMGIDIVLNPSYKGAVFDKGNICESQNFEEDEDPELGEADIAKEMKRRAELEEALTNLLRDSFDKAVADGAWYGDYAAYKAQYEKRLREMMGLSEPPEDIKQAEKKLTEEQVKDRTWSHYEEALRSGYRGSFAEWKEKYPKLVEQASKGIKLSEKKAEKPKKPFVGDARFYYNEAIKAGYKGTLAEFKEQHPEYVAEDYEEKLAEEIKRKEPETLDEEAQRIFEGLKKANPNSALKLEHVRNMLEKEQEPKRERKLREFAIRRVNISIAGCGAAPSQQMLEKMVAEEIEFIKEERAERKRKNWEAYKRLLDE